MSTPLGAPQAAANASVAKDFKPSLAGVRNKQRKGVAKATAKFEPEDFRDQIIKHLSTLPPGDLDAVSAKLDTLGNQLDYRKYEGALFEVLLVGGLLAPGGSYVDDGAEKSPFSILTSTKYPVEAADMKKHVEVFNKLLRRYKYLQKLFEENALTGVLQYINKFDAESLDKLSFALALFISNNLASAAVLTTLQKEHLVKDGVSLDFLTKFFKAYLSVESIDHLSNTLRKSNNIDVSAFFAPQKRDAATVNKYFKNAKLEVIANYLQKQRSAQVKAETLSHLKMIVAAEESQDELLAYLTEQSKTCDIPAVEFIELIWYGLMSNLDLSSRPDQINDMLVKAVGTHAEVMAAFAVDGLTEVALINTIQVWAYQNTKVIGAFARILKTLYAKDVISDKAVLYWHRKGSKAQARQHFLKASEPLVKFLHENQDDDDDDEDDEEDNEDGKADVKGGEAGDVKPAEEGN